MNDTVITRSLRIYGRVQGVGFRAFVRDEALALGLSGFVRNRSDGTVEAMATGVPAKVDVWVERCKVGPSFSRVDRIEIEKILTPGSAKNFFIEPTL